MQAVDKTRWAQLSPLLDELLDLEPGPRAARLRALREADEAAADVLAELLGRLTAVEREGFLETPAVLPEASMAGQTIGAYTLERELGHGGMGSVWLARRTDGRYEGRVAVKFLNAGLMARGGSERFAREGNILARLAHPNIARLVDAGVAQSGQPYLVLEYIDGEPIDRHCDTRALDVTARVRLFLDVLAAVAHAHTRLILHRDIKPVNILVTAAGEVKLLDFGIAKLMDDAALPAQATELTQAAGRAFTPAYAAPEQVEGGDVTTATDVYALGVLLYMLLTGTHPTAASTTSAPLDQLRSVVETEPKRLSDAVVRRTSGSLARELRGDLDNIVATALKKAPSERYANAAAFADDLQRYLNDEPVAARPDTAAYLLAKFVRRHRFGVAAAGAIVLALTAGLGAAVWQAKEAQRQHVQAEGLIEFMLGDLRRKLQPVGRLDVLDSVGAKALAYYDAQDARRLDANSLGRRARALHLIGEIAEARGNLAEASKVFQSAAQSTGALMERSPDEGQRIFDHAQSVYWVGYVAWRRGQAGDAENAFVRYRELAERLLRLDPERLDWRVEKAYAAQNLGVLYLEHARPTAALALFSQTRSVFLEGARARPDLLFELAETLGWIAKAREALGEFDAAIEAQQAKVDALHKVPDADRNRRVQRLLANAAYELGRLNLNRGQPALAATAAAAAVQRFDGLFAQDESNLDWLAQGCVARLGLTEVELALGEHAAARATLARAMSDIDRLTATDATQTKWQIAFRGRALALATRLALARWQAPPVAPMQAYLATVAQFEAAGTRLASDQGQIVAAVELALGDSLQRDANERSAIVHWRAAARRLSFQASGDDPVAMNLLAHAHVRLGEVHEARALLQRIHASSYRHPAYADLRQRLSRVAGAAAATP